MSQIIAFFVIAPFTRLYERVGILLKWATHLHDRIYEIGFGTIKWFNPATFEWSAFSSQESGRSFICVSRIFNLPFSLRFWYLILILLIFVACYKLYCTLEEKNNFSVVLQCSVRFYLQFFIGGLMSYLRYLSLIAYGGVQHIFLLYDDLLFVFTSCSL